MTTAELNELVAAIEAIRGYCDLTVTKTEGATDLYVCGLRCAAEDILTLLPEGSVG